MTTTQTLNRVRTELQILSEALGDPVPAWGLVPGATSAFIHPGPPVPCPQCQGAVPLAEARVVQSVRCPNCGHILFGEGALNSFEAAGAEVDLIALVAHEFWHWHQFNNQLDQDRPNIREINARRFAKQWIQRRLPGREAELTPEPNPREPGIGIDFQGPEEGTEILQGERFAEATSEDLIFLDEAFKPRGRPISTPLWLRFKLQRDGPNYPYALWRDFREFLKKFGYKHPRYEAIRSLIWILHEELEFLEIVQQEDSEFGEDRNLYDVVVELADDPRWIDPTGEVYGRDR